MKIIFLNILVLSLIACAAIAIYLFLFGKLNTEAFQILFTTLSASGYSLTALAAGSLNEKHPTSILAKAGIISSIIGFIVTTLVVWNLFNSSDLMIKSALILITTSAALGHICLLLHIQSKDNVVKLSLIATLLSISIVAGIVISIIIDHDLANWRLLGVFVVLDALGTIVTPILNKIR